MESPRQMEVLLSDFASGDKRKYLLVRLDISIMNSHYACCDV